MLKKFLTKFLLCFGLLMFSVHVISSTSFAAIIIEPILLPCKINPPVTIQPPPLITMSTNLVSKIDNSLTKDEELSTTCDIVANVSNISTSGFTLQLQLLDTYQNKRSSTFTVIGIYANKVAETGSDISIDFKGLGAGKTYTAKIEAGSGTSIFAESSITVTLPQDTTPPTIPTNLTAVIINSTSIRLEWVKSQDDSSSIIVYEIFQDNTLIGATSETSLTLTNLAAKEYTFKVRAKDGYNNYSLSSNTVKVNLIKKNYVYVYDSANRLLQIRTETKVITFIYDSNGNVVRIVSEKL